MKNPYHALLMLIAGATQKELAAQIHYLKVELEIARSFIQTMQQECLDHFIVFGAKHLNHLVKIAATHMLPGSAAGNIAETIFFARGEGHFIGLRRCVSGCTLQRGEVKAGPAQ